MKTMSRDSCGDRARANALLCVRGSRCNSGEADSAVLLARGLARRLPVRWPAATRLVPAYTIGSLAAFWLIERTTRIFVD